MKDARLPRPDKAQYWRQTTSMGEVRMLCAHYVHQNFAKHTHDGYGVGVIEQGAMAFDYMGQRMVAPYGHVNLVVPGEPHDGHAAVEQGWIYRMFYLEAEALRHVASQVAGRERDLPFFGSGVIDDAALAASLQHTHHLFGCADVTPLERDSSLLNALALWIERHSDDPPPTPEPIAAQLAVARVRDLIETEYARTLKLDELATAAGLSPYHLLRVFQSATGLSPHLYLNQTRIRRAERLIRSGRALSAVAADVGYSDQSHLNRQFKRIVGITPGQYRKIVQD